MNRKVAILRWLNGVQGTTVDYPGGVGGECVDLVNDYLMLVHAHGAVRRNAADWRMARLDPTRWVWEANAPTNSPTTGAIVVWGGPNAIAGTTANGHVAVALLADADLLWTMDQNWAGRRTADTTWHTYHAVVGWWKPVVGWWKPL